MTIDDFIFQPLPKTVNISNHKSANSIENQQLRVIQTADLLGLHTWTLFSLFHELKPCLTRVTFFGDDNLSLVSDVVAPLKSYAPPVIGT